MEWLSEPYQWAFMQQALLIACIVSVPCALLSCFLVLRGWSLMGDAISHAILPGIVVAYMLKIPIIIGAFVASMICAGLIGYISEHCRVKRDTAMGVVFSGMFALGVVMFVKLESNIHLDHILFGDVMALKSEDLWQSGLLALFVVGFILLRWRDLLLFIFDQVQVKASGLSTTWLYYMLLVTISLSVVATLKAAGLILAIALLIAPGAIAFLCTRRVVAMMVVAVLVNLFSSFIGMTLSFHWDSAPAPTIVVMLSAIFILVFLLRIVYSQRQARAHGRALL